MAGATLGPSRRLIAEATWTIGDLGLGTWKWDTELTFSLQPVRPQLSGLFDSVSLQPSKFFIINCISVLFGRSRPCQLETVIWTFSSSQDEETLLAPHPD